MSKICPSSIFFKFFQIGVNYLQSILMNKILQDLLIWFVQTEDLLSAKKACLDNDKITEY